MSLYKTGEFFFLLFLMGTVTSTLGERTGQFWVISDLHYDFTYEVQDTPESCRTVIPKKQLGQFGNYECDLPLTMLKQTIDSMKQLEPEVDFIVWTGDSVMHTRRDEKLIMNQTVNIDLIKDITNLINEAFPNVQLIPTIGNHDFFPNAQTSSALLDGLANAWLNGSEPQTTTFKKGGYYSTDISPGLKLLNMNTILYYNSNKNINPKSNPDPDGQFVWMKNQLTEAKKGKKKVFITGHIAPGLTPEGHSWFYTSYNDRFVQLVQEFADIITAMFFGHDHQTSFKIISQNGTGTVPIFVAPSVTPWTYKYNHNPAMWLVTYDRQSQMPVRIDQYYVDLLQANRENNINYRLSYSVPRQYKMKDLSAESLLGLREAMKLDDQLFSRYMKHMYADVTTKKQPEINLDLKINVLCAMNSTDEKSFRTCKAHGIKQVDSGSLKVSINMTNLLLIALIGAVVNFNFSSI